MAAEQIFHNSNFLLKTYIFSLATYTVLMFCFVFPLSCLPSVSSKWQNTSFNPQGKSLLNTQVWISLACLLLLLLFKKTLIFHWKSGWFSLQFKQLHMWSSFFLRQHTLYAAEVFHAYTSILSHRILERCGLTCQDLLIIFTALSGTFLSKMVFFTASHGNKECND